MFGRLRRKAVVVRGTDFCDQCGQVCTAECRARARMDRVRAEIALQVFPR